MDSYSSDLLVEGNSGLEIYKVSDVIVASVYGMIEKGLAFFFTCSQHSRALPPT